VSLESGRAEFRQLADLIRADIDAGTYRPGQALPSEPQLADRYGVSRQTVNNATKILRSEGYVRVERGRGTIVRELPMLTTERTRRQAERTGTGQARGAFQAEIERQGLQARPLPEVRVDVVPVPAAAAALLGIRPGGLALARSRRQFANDVPVQLATSYYPLDIAEGTQIEQEDPGPGGSYSRLADLGHEPVSFREILKVRLPDENESRLLRMDAEQRVITIRRIARDKNGRVVEVNDMVLPAHQWEIVSDW